MKQLIDITPADKARGERIAAARRAKRLTQEELAELVGRCEATIGFWESGQVCPRMDALSALLNSLDVSLSWLMSGKS